MRKHRNNPTIQLSDLDLECHEQENSHLTLNATIRMAQIEEPIGETLYSIGIRKAYLVGEFEGVEIAPGTKYGEQIATSRQENNSQSSTSKISISGQLNLSSASAEFNAQREYQKGREIETREKHLPIRSRTGNSWELLSRNPADKLAVLDLTYVNNETLCELRPVDRANRCSINFKLVSKRMHFIATEVDANDGRPFRGRRAKTNKERVIGIILARSLSVASQQPIPNETIVLSQVCFEDE